VFFFLVFVFNPHGCFVFNDDPFHLCVVDEFRPVFYGFINENPRVPLGPVWTPVTG